MQKLNAIKAGASLPAIYTHPEDKGLSFDPQHCLLTAWNEGQTVTVPIGPEGLAEVGRALLALASAMGCDEVGGAK